MAQHARDSAELRRLCAERDEAKRQVAALRQHKTDYMEAAEVTRKALESELTALKAQQEKPKAEVCMGCVEQASRIRELEHKMDYYKAQQVGQVPVGYLADDGGSMVAFFRAEEKDQFDAFCAEAEPLNKVALYTAPQPAPAEDVAQLPPLGESLRSILGRPNFACSGIAKHLRGMGYAIPNKAEEEQAATIHWLVNLYLKHGEDWATHANAALAAHDKQSGGEV